MTATRATAARRAGGALFVSGVLLLALNLRPALTAVPSILPEIGARLGLSPSLLTVLTGVPVLCFGLFSPLATRAGRRFGDERSLAFAVAAVAAGQAIRVELPAAGFFAGTVVAAGGIAFMNVLLSSLVKRRAPAHAGLLVGSYLALLYVGAMISSATSVPLYRAGGHSLRDALGVWAIPAAAALLLWLPQVRHRTPPAEAAASLSLRRVPLAWAITGFMGLQSLTYYAGLSFLPELFRSRGMSATAAGLTNTVAGAGGLVAALLAPVLVQRFAIARPLLAGATAAGLASAAATLVVPLGAVPAVMAVLGASQGVYIALALYFMIARSATPAIAGSLSGMAQGVGYVVATAGPLLMGFLHTATRGWVASVGMMMAFTVAVLGFGLVAARPAVIAGGAAGAAGTDRLSSS